MGKSSAPAAPDYRGQAIATGNSGKYNEVTPYGSIGWTARPGMDPNNPQPGDYSRTTTLSPEQQQLYNQQIGLQLNSGLAANSALTDLSQAQDYGALKDSIYNQTTKYYDQNFGDQEAAMRTRLQNSGLTEGSEAYDRELRNFGQARDDAYGQAADKAVQTAYTQKNADTATALNKLTALMALSRGQSPSSGNSSGGAPVDYSGSAANQYNAALGQTNAENANAAGTASTAASLGMLAYLAFGASDRRLKSNVTCVGTGYKGLPVYEYDIADRRERGYMADEVEAVEPSAVAEFNGIKMVAYGMIGGRP